MKLKEKIEKIRLARNVYEARYRAMKDSDNPQVIKAADFDRATFMSYDAVLYLLEYGSSARL